LEPRLTAGFSGCGGNRLGRDGTGRARGVRARRLAWALLASASVSGLGRPPARRGVPSRLRCFFTAAAVTGAVPGPLAPRRKENPAGRARRLSIQQSARAVETFLFTETFLFFFLHERVSYEQVYFLKKSTPSFFFSSLIFSYTLLFVLLNK
jgi:hypothetical protein